MPASAAPRADTFGATSGAATPGTSAPGFGVLNSRNGPSFFSFDGLTGGPGLFSLVLGPFKGAPPRLKSVDGRSSSSHVRKSKTPFFARSGMRPWTPVMAFITEATPAHELGSMKDPLPSITTMLP